MKKILLLLISIMLVLGISGCKPTKVRTDDIYVFYTSDVHCGVDKNLGFASAKAIVEDTKAEHPYVALVDMGDYLQGGTLGVLTQGEEIISLMNEMGYDAATIGNHEFDYGIPRLVELIKMANFPIVGSNIIYTGNKENALADVPGYTIKDFDGTKVAFVGVLTPSSIRTSTPTNFVEDGEFVYDFCSQDDGLQLANAVQTSVDAARKEGADYVILLSHLGTRESDRPYDAITLIKNTKGIDAVLDGHAHAEIIGDYYLNAEGKEIPLSSVGTQMANLGELIIDKEGNITTLLISEYDKQDEKTTEVVTKANNRVEEILSEVIGTTSFTLSITDENGIRLARNREIGLADFVTDAFREELETDVVMINGGSVRSTVEEGEITYGDIINVAPFMNSLSSCYATGQQIMDALEFGSMYTEKITSFDEKAVGEFGGFLQVSGLKYTIDTSVPTPVVLDENKMFVSIEGERRVKDVMILQDGEYVPIDPEKIYSVGSSDYVLFNMGDGNTVFTNCEPIIKAGPTDSEVIIRKIMTIGSIDERYKTTEGRITVE
ncbi:MAG: bifunctional metallophosphatase/5'-nucleotidase [Erysipelotrichaceae bacterium]|nr:bifunctional metallophosphatase/5'-nucleotidase [Erysipelotrichaceae bacterium]